MTKSNRNKTTPPMPQPAARRKQTTKAARPVKQQAAPGAARTNNAAVPNRKNLFPDERTWWMVDLHAPLTLTQGATPLMRRCMSRYGWNEEYGRAALKAYKQFLQIKKEKRDWQDNVLMPSRTIEKVWHEHILDTENYAHDCVLLCGHVVYYNPNIITVSNGVISQRYKQTYITLRNHVSYRELDDSEDGVWREVIVGARTHTAPVKSEDDGRV